MDSNRWGRIVSIEPVGHGDFYDLTVPDTHNYAANGIVNHNSGKTYSAAIYYDATMRAVPGTKGRILAPTKGEALQSCVTGTSGLKTLFPDLKLTTEAGTSTTLLRWPNGSEAAILGVWTRGEIAKMRAISNRTLDWFEEFTHMRFMEETFREAATGRRIGRPRALITTTPTAHPYWAKVLAMRNVVMTEGTMFDNPHLSEEYKRDIMDLYEGTHLEGQEIWGKILTDVDGALFTSVNLNEHRVGLGEFSKIETVVRSVGVDPATGTGTTGIVAAASYLTGDVWNIAALEDRSLTDAEPLDWARTAIELALEWDCHAVVTERTGAGKMVESTMKIARQNMVDEANTAADAAEPEVAAGHRERARQIAGLRIVFVHARDGKRTRAEPVALLHEQGRGHILGHQDLLENQLTTWVPGTDSPDRLDAYVWAATDLIGRFRTGRSGVSPVGTYR